jgi:hypothetical protein
MANVLVSLSAFSATGRRKANEPLDDGWLGRKVFTFLAAIHVRCCYLGKSELAKALMLDGSVENPPS